VTDLPTDIRQVSVSRVTLGLVLSVATIAFSIAWSSSRLVARLDAVEATVDAIQDSMDMQSFARVVDVSEDLDEVWAEVGRVNTALADVMDSVGVLLMRDEQSYWED
jgi:Kef-type K+ transport system membrane component KefB